MFALALMAIAAAPEPLRVAVPSFNTINVQTESAGFFLDRFANRLRASGLKVTTATEMEAVLGLERQKVLTGCQDSTNCAAELAAALGVDAIVRGRLAKFGAQFEATLTLIDAKDASALGSATGSAANESQLLTMLERHADELAAALLQRRGRTDDLAQLAASSSGGRPLWLSLAPGIGGVVAGGVGALLLRSSYARVDELATTADPEGVAATARAERVSGFSLVGVGVAAIATSAFLLATGQKQGPVPVVTVTPTGAALSLAGSLP